MADMMRDVLPLAVASLVAAAAFMYVNVRMFER